MSENISWEGGIYAQSCGHYLHLDCHKAYVQALGVCFSDCFSDIIKSSQHDMFFLGVVKVLQSSCMVSQIAEHFSGPGRAACPLCVPIC